MLPEIHEEVNLRARNNSHLKASNRHNSRTSELSFFSNEKEKNYYEETRQGSAKKSPNKSSELSIYKGKDLET